VTGAKLKTEIRATKACLVEMGSKDSEDPWALQVQPVDEVDEEAAVNEVEKDLWVTQAKLDFQVTTANQV
jgi:hypothetical protein